MTFILVVHIALMLLSLSATSAMAIAAAASQRVSPTLIRFNLLSTAAGILCGVALLASQPIGAKCALLLTYTVVFAAAYAFIARRNQSLIRSAS